MAEPTGLEPATSCVTGRRSNQLNYGSMNLPNSKSQISNRILKYGAWDFVLHNGGRNRDRTCDPLLVRQMLSQLSYSPL